MRNDLSDTYADRFLSLAARHSIPVFWLLPPVPSRICSEHDANGFNAYFTSRAAAIIKKYPNVTVIDSRRASYPERVFCDVARMNRDGACAFTATVAETHEPSPDRSRHIAAHWSALPPFRDVPRAIAVEDLNESKKTVRRR